MKSTFTKLLALGTLSLGLFAAPTTFAQTPAAEHKSDTETGHQRMRKRPDIDHVWVEGTKRRVRHTIVGQVAVGCILYNRHIILVHHLEKFVAGGHCPTGAERILMIGSDEDESGPVSFILKLRLK